jgi:hypothetical protein
MSTHTPGSWTAELLDPYDEQEIEIVSKSDCQLHPIAKAVWGDGCRRMDEAEANARLIAAAPELLAALVRVVRYAESEPDGGATVEVHRANIEQARAAIAKATDDGYNQSR